MSKGRFIRKLAVQVPWTAMQLLVESLLLATIAKRRAGEQERPWGERYERIGPGWLAGVLREGGELDCGGTVEQLSLERFGEIGQMSAIFRLKPSYSAGASGPDSLVLKTTTPEMKNRVFNAALGVFERELLSYQLPHPDSGLLRPKCWYTGQHRITKSAMLVLDDLSDWRGVPAYEKFSPEDAMRVSVALAKHHAHWWQKSGLTELGFKTTLDIQQETLGPMCSMAWGKAAKIMAPLVEPDIFNILSGYVTHQEAIARRMVAGPTTLIHGDLNTNNLFFDDTGNRVCAIDWQSTHIGHWAEDLAYVALMGLTGEDCAAHEGEIIAAHHRVLADHGIALSEKEHRDGYALGVFKTGAMLILGALIIDPKKDMQLYERYKESIDHWASAAQRHRLADVLTGIR